ncbi:MAG: type IV secretory system conjugative DNA transfer family protein [Methylobacterium sp.]|nr:type IV secretory system conjugative DNA transfer family protein [Methylobacterium sp.]
MSGTLVTPKARLLSDQWRKYWRARWHSLPEWEAPRFRRLLSADDARKPKRSRWRGEIQPALVADYPQGRSPFLGVLTLGSTPAASPASGVLEFPVKGHLLTIAPTRTGKGTCHIVPNLLLYGGSCLVIDVKGENYDLTARRRAAMFPGARVYRFAPLDEGSARYNPLDFIRVSSAGGSSPDSYADARLLADMLLPPKPKEEYWDIEARNLLTLLIFYVAVRFSADDPRRTMREVMNLLFPAEQPGSDTKGIDRSLEIILAAAETLKEPLLASLSSTFREHEPKVRSNIVSSCRADMQIWLSERLLQATEASDFLFSDLKSSMCRPAELNPAPTSIYIVIPPQYLREYRGVMRMMVGLAVAELTRKAHWKNWEGWETAPPCDVMFLLDELPILGNMPPVVNGLAYLAGYGIQIWSFAQNIGQLKSAYGEDWQNFTANAGAISFFGVSDPDTADYVARLLGETDEYEHRLLSPLKFRTEPLGLNAR